MKYGNRINHSTRSEEVAQLSLSSPSFDSFNLWVHSGYSASVCLLIVGDIHLSVPRIEYYRAHTD